MTAPLVVWAAADAPYWAFVPLFTWSVLHSNPAARVAVDVDDLDAFRRVHGAALEHLDDRTAGRIDLVGHGRSGFPARVRRFVIAPPEPATFTYITDVDLVFTEDVLAQHLPVLRRTGLDFNNIVRDPTAARPRLTGLHLTRTDAHFPTRPPRDLRLDRVNDEHLLWRLVADRHPTMPDLVSLGATRPLPGLHVSVYSRSPLPDATGRPSWGPSGCAPDVAGILDSEEFALLERLLAPPAQVIVHAVRMYCAAVATRLAASEDPHRSGLGEILAAPILTGGHPRRLEAVLAPLHRLRRRRRPRFGLR